MFDNGSQWLRADFHLHTIKDKEFKYSKSDDMFTSDYIDKLIKEQINIGIITNHNKFDLGEYKNLRKKAMKENILLLPGVELSVKEGKNGIHCLIVFNPDEWIVNDEKHIDSFLTSAFLGINNRENENTRCNLDLPSVLNTLDNCSKDYFLIFAHVDQNSGLFKECDGGLIKSLAKKHRFNERVLGFQKSRSYDNLNKFKEWTGLELACVEGSDCKSIDDIGKGNKKTYIKVGDLSYQAVKYALQDYESRVSEIKPTLSHGYVKSISFQGGKLNNLTIPFSPSLNTIIGIRGSGKSSILEVLRYALNLEATTDSKYKDDLINYILGSGGEITVNIIDKYGEEYKVKRVFGEKPHILDSKNNNINFPMYTLINNPLYFGQKDLSFTDEAYEFELLEKLVGGKLDDYKHTLIDINKTLEANIRSFLEFDNITEKIDALEARNNALQNNIGIFEEKGLAKKLDKQAKYKKDAIAIDNTIEEANEVFKKYNEVFTYFDSKEFSIVKYQSNYNDDIISSVQSLTKDITINLSKIKQFISNIEEILKKLVEKKNELNQRINSLSDEFAEIRREINDESIDPEKYLEYIEEKTSNAKKIKDLRNQNLQKGNLENKIKINIKDRNDCLYNIFQEYKTEIDKINKSQKELEISIHFKGDIASFIKSMQDEFKGTGINKAKYKAISNEFVDYVSIYEEFLFGDGIKVKSLITDNEYSKLSNVLFENYPNLIKFTTNNLVEIKYHNKLLEKHSIGQRASAIILLILSQKENDLIIIDQPEDDLDNQVIYSEVINTIRKRKNDIQFIFATHNANIPVLGDAESIISMKCESNNLNYEPGNIDNPQTHNKIVDIMEGGDEAFKRRKMIYSNWRRNRK